MTTSANPDKAFLVVGMGASAGGLGALERFLDELPVDFRFALVFIQHLSPKYKSLLPELLGARRPSLVIQQISDGLKIQPGRLYLAPPGREVRLRNNIFQTTVHAEGLVHLPIDEFFLSLAEDAGDHSIAVIFSGAGTDGARGCQAVRSVGGTVLVQDPQTAEFDSMPLAAIATGQADAALSPEDIAAELQRLQGIGPAGAGRESPIALPEYEGFFRILQEKAGSRFNHYKKSVVSRRIRRRMYLQGLSAVKEYLDLLAANDAEAANLASDLMIGVTSFFRDRVAWKALNQEAIRKIAAENSTFPVRVWTPASATGEEAYSIAMMLLRELDLAGKKREIHVFATDVNDRALERAREGKYPGSITADVPQEYIQRYFTPTDDGNFLVVNKDVRESVVFARQDLLTDPPFSKLDLIICRNFLIYLEPEAQEKCIKLFHYALNTGGYLFLGNAETVGRKSAQFKSIGHKQCRIYRKLEIKPASRLPVSVPYAKERQAPSAKQAQLTGPGRSVIEIIQERLIEDYGPAAVAIDQNYEIIYHNGPTNRYLTQPRGVPTQNLLELVPETLRSRIRGALYRSGREGKPVVVRASVAGDDHKKRQVTFRIIRAAENISIVVFQEKAVQSKKEAVETIDPSVIEETAIRQLESELSATRADLQSHIEQLKSMNEEFQSSNEELQAANEELETSREELQSLNEELITVNSQLQGKIEEQDATNNDLNNFLASANIPTIFLDPLFRVKRFTPAMLKLVQLLPSDIGRPIVDMSRENLGPDLIPDAQSVLEQLSPVRRELELSGAWFVRTTLPYRTADNRIEGVVITYNDVTELKRAEDRTRHLASFPQLNPNPIIEVDASGRVIFANPGTERNLESLGLDKGEVTGFLPKDLTPILKELEKKNELSVAREVTIRDRVFSETVQLIPRFNVARIYAYDITERKKAEEAQARLAAIVESAEDAIIGKDLDGIIQTWNVGAENIFGYRAEEVIGKPVSLLVPSGHTDEVPEILARITRGEHIENFETLRMRKDGTVIPVSLRFSAIRDANGRVVGASKIAHDITERRNREQQLAEQARLLDLSSDAICIRDARNRITYWNDGAMKMFGFTEEEGLGKVTHELLRTEFPEPLKRIEEKLYLDGRWSGELVHTRQDGCRIIVSSRWVLTHDAQGTPLILESDTDITERKKAEEELAWSNQRVNDILASIQDDFYVLDRDWNFVYANRLFTAKIGKEPGDFIGNNFWKMFPKNLGTDLEENFRAAMEKREIRRFDIAGKYTDAWYRLTAFPSAEGLTVLGSDVTARKKAEEALRQSEVRFRAIFENSVDAVGVSKNGRHVLVNPSYLSLFGYGSNEELSGKPILDLIAPAERGKIIEYSRTREQGGAVPRSYETRGLKKDGTEFIMDVNAVTFSMDEETFTLVILRDITEQKKAGEALRESETRFRTLFETMTEGFSIDEIILDDAGKPVDLRYVSINPAFERHTGLKAEDIVGRTVRELFPDTVPIWFERYGKVALTGEPDHFEERFGPLNKWFEISVYRTEPGRFAVVFFDITERKKAEADILKLSEDMAARNVELESANKEMESFVYSISHDLRAPIRTMSGFAKVLYDDYAGKLDAQGQDYLGRILRGSEKSTQLINDLLRLSSISRQELSRIDVNLSKKASKIVEELREMQPGRNVEVVVQDGLIASADPRLIELVLSNLLGNSWKFTSKTEKAKIEFGAADSLLRIAEWGLRNETTTELIRQGKTVYFVRDNGAGFNMSYADKMFWPFHRLHSETEFEGTGIGLTIVERVIRKHGGKIWAEAEVGKGAILYFTLA